MGGTIVHVQERSKPTMDMESLAATGLELPKNVHKQDFSLEKPGFRASNPIFSKYRLARSSFRLCFRLHNVYNGVSRWNRFKEVTDGVDL